MKTTHCGDYVNAARFMAQLGAPQKTTKTLCGKRAPVADVRNYSEPVTCPECAAKQTATREVSQFLADGGDIRNIDPKLLETLIRAD